MNNQAQLLFMKYDVSAVKENTIEKMNEEISSYSGNKLLNTSLDELTKYFVSKYEITPIHIYDDQITLDQDEISIDVSQDHFRAIHNRNKPFFIKGTRYTLYVPFEGEGDLLLCRPSTSTLNPPRGQIEGNTLLLSTTSIDHELEIIRSELENLLKRVKEYLSWLKNDLGSFNNNLLKISLQQITARREKLLKDQGIVASLGFPLRERAVGPKVYIAPEVRKKAIPKPPSAGTGAYFPEPTLELKEYDNILSIIEKTAIMLERSPQTFRGMKEESLRDQFLVPLNSHYEGQASGETFNFNGKTDILIRDGDRSVFIAECKIWRGAKSLEAAIDQLLGYATWRDTKTAILIFNRNKVLSEVLSQIPKILNSHTNFKKALHYPSQTGFRCVIVNKDDPNREIILTILIFEVPK